MNKKFVYQRNESSKEGCYSYGGTVDQGNRLGIGILIWLIKRLLFEWLVVNY